MSFKEVKDKFTAFSGKINYTGDSGVFFTGDGSFTLNGKPMDKHKEYKLNHGDVIDDLNFKPPTSDDLKWEFRD